MAKYNVTIQQPDGFNHWQAFVEVRDSVAWSLAALGHEVSTTANWFSEHGETNIIFGAELFADFQRIPKNSIVYNLEQPSHPNLAKVRRQVKESGCAVWEYSMRSVAEWKAEGIEARHVPVGYTPILSRIPEFVSDLKWDVCFFGWMTPRRAELVEQLRKAGLKVFASANCYGGGRDFVISQSKVCLNVHHDGRDRFEIVRCSYLMANGKCIVSEPSSDDDEYNLRGLTIAPYRILVDTVASLCQSYSRVHGEAARTSIRNRDYTKAIEAALDTTPVEIDKAPVSSIPAIKLERAASKRNFLEEARKLRAPADPRIQQRYERACKEGDMKDFAPWLKEHAHGNVMEIGVRDGASTSSFLMGIAERGGHLYSVDVDPKSGSLFTSPNWTFIHADSKNFDAVVPKMPFEIDVLLIDGDHSAAGVINDCEYARQLRPGGCVIFHDIAPEKKPSGCNDMSWPGDDVKRVYESLCDNMGKSGWTHEEPPGRYGLGVLWKPLDAPAPDPTPIGKGALTEDQRRDLDSLAEQGCY